MPALNTSAIIETKANQLLYVRNRSENLFDDIVYLLDRQPCPSNSDRRTRNTKQAKISVSVFRPASKSDHTNRFMSGDGTQAGSKVRGEVSSAARMRNVA